jgi:hypothetical protein
MEVHHHPDLHHKRKIFKEYILEFLMIFLTVFTNLSQISLKSTRIKGSYFLEKQNFKEYLLKL